MTPEERAINELPGIITAARNFGADKAIQHFAAAIREAQREQMERDAEIVQIQIAAARSIHVCTGCAELARNRIRGEFDAVNSQQCKD